MKSTTFLLVGALVAIAIIAIIKKHFFETMDYDLPTQGNAISFGFEGYEDAEASEIVDDAETDDEEEIEGYESEDEDIEEDVEHMTTSAKAKREAKKVKAKLRAAAKKLKAKTNKAAGLPAAAAATAVAATGVAAVGMTAVPAETARAATSTETTMTIKVQDTYHDGCGECAEGRPSFAFNNDAAFVEAMKACSFFRIDDVAGPFRFVKHIPGAHHGKDVIEFSPRVRKDEFAAYSDHTFKFVIPKATTEKFENTPRFQELKGKWDAYKANTGPALSDAERSELMQLLDMPDKAEQAEEAFEQFEEMAYQGMEYAMF